MTKIIPFTPPGKYHHPCASEKELRALARGGAMRLSEAISLMHGFLHSGRTSDTKISYLADYAELVSQLKAAIIRGEVVFPVTPRELLLIAERLQLCLPRAFVDEAILCMPRSSQRPFSIPETEEMVHPPRKVGRPRSGELTSSCLLEPAKRRVTKCQGREYDIIAIARKLALEHVRQFGELPFAHGLLKDLQRITGRSRANLRRAFSTKNLLSSNELAKAMQYRRATLREESALNNPAHISNVTI